jgi:hypothetical protein
MSALELSTLLLWLVVGVLVFGLAALYAAFGKLASASGQARSIDLATGGPALGQRVSVPDSHDVQGRRFSIATAHWLFVSPGCPGCVEAKQRLRTVFPASGEPLVIAFRGAHQDAAEWAADLPGAAVVSDEDGSVFSTFNVPFTPYYAVLEDGTCVAKGAATRDFFNRFSEVADRSRATAPAVAESKRQQPATADLRR